jgi:hypothetical protein
MWTKCCCIVTLLRLVLSWIVALYYLCLWQHTDFPRVDVGVEDVWFTTGAFTKVVACTATVSISASVVDWYSERFLLRKILQLLQRQANTAPAYYFLSQWVACLETLHAISPTVQALILIPFLCPFAVPIDGWRLAMLLITSVLSLWVTALFARLFAYTVAYAEMATLLLETRFIACR